MFALDNFYARNEPPNIPKDSQIERATQLVSTDFEYSATLLRVFQEFLYLKDPDQLELFIQRRLFVIHGDGDTFHAGECSGGAKCEEEMILPAEYSRIQLLKEIYERITKQLVPAMSAMANAELKIGKAQEWLMENFEPKFGYDELE